MKKTAAALLALTASSLVFATPSADSFYFGGKLGQSSFHKGVKLYSESDATVNKTQHKNSGTAYGVYAGYRVTDYFSVEAGWQKLANNQYYTKNGSTYNKTNHNVNVVDLGVKFNQFVGDNVNVYLGLGAGVALNKVDATFTQFDSNAEKSVKKTTFSPFVSAGVEYYFADSFAVGAEYKVYNQVAKYKGTKDGKVVKAVSKDSATTARTKYAPDAHLLQATATYLFGQVKPVAVVTREKFELKSDVLFATNKYNLNASASEAFADVLARYNNAENATVEVVGHADRTGSAKYNLALSEKRAHSVANYLVQQGVKAEAITSVKGVGSSEPVTNGCYDVKKGKALRACLAPDRRVDVFISGVVKSK